MSLDPYILDVDNRVIFANKITKKVSGVSPAIEVVDFTDSSSMRFEDGLWEIARLDLPDLFFANRHHSNCYYLKDGSYPNNHLYDPSELLKLLKRDVAALEADGIKEKKEVC
jgi:hypothetical protein